MTIIRELPVGLAPAKNLFYGQGMSLERILDTRALVNCRFRAAVAFACRRAVVALAASLLFAGASLAADRVAGANETMNMEPGARSAALGSATMAVDGDYLGLVSNPHQLSSVRYLWASFSPRAKALAMTFFLVQTDAVLKLFRLL